MAFEIELTLAFILPEDHLAAPDETCNLVAHHTGRSVLT